MRNLTIEEQRIVSRIAEATARHRHTLIAAQAKDREARFFQAQADFHSMEVLLHHGTGREIPEETAEFFQTHLNGHETAYKCEISAFIKAVENMTGRPINL